ncbi:MAG: hypothetical protein MUP80_16440 [Acidobacteriia bacterium]|nr:hypothetical protein [Terriglobia bacterium]
MPDKPVIQITADATDLRKFVADVKARMNDARVVIAGIQSQIASQHAKIVAGITGVEQQEAKKRIDAWRTEAAQKRAELAKLRVDAVSATGQMTAKLGGAPWPLARQLTGTGILQFLGITSLPAILSGIARNLRDAAIGGGEFAHSLEIISAKTGISVPQLQKLEFVGKTVGLTLDDVVIATRKFSAAIVGGGGEGEGLAGGSNKAARVLAALGIATRDAADKARSMDAVLADLAEVFARNAEGPEKARIAIELFGRSGLNLIPFLNKGREGIRALLAEMGDPVAVEEMARQFERWELANAKLDQSVLQLKSSLAGLLGFMAGSIDKLAAFIDLLARGADLSRPPQGIAGATWTKLTPAGEAEFRRLTTAPVEEPGQMYSAQAAQAELARQRQLASGREYFKFRFPAAAAAGRELTEEEKALGFILREHEVLGKKLVQELDTRKEITAEMAKAAKIAAGEKEGKEKESAWDKAFKSAQQRAGKLKADLWDQQRDFQEWLTKGAGAAAVPGKMPQLLKWMLPERLNIDQLRDALAQLDAQSQLGNNTTAQEIVLRSQLNGLLASQIRGRLALGVATDAEREGLEKLVQELSQSQKATDDLKARQTTWATSALGVLDTLCEVASKFGVALPKGLVQFAATFEMLKKTSAAFKDNVQAALESLSKPEEAAAVKAGTPLDALKEMFASWENFTASMKAGGLGQIAGIFATIAANFKQSIVKGIGAAMMTFGMFIPVVGPIVAAIGAAMAMGGKEILPFLFGPTIPLGVKRAQSRKAARQIQKEIDAIVTLFNSGGSTIKKTLAALEAEKQKAIARLSGRKGAGKELEGIVSDIDKAMAELKAKQKEIFEAFDKEMNILRLPEYYRDIGESIQSMTDKVKAFLDAGGSAAKAQEYLLRSEADLYANLNRELRDDELAAIDLLERRIDLETQRSKVIADAAKAEREVRTGLGLARPLTPAQEAATRIKQIREQAAEQVASIDRQLKMLDAQVEGQAVLFGLTQDLTSLEQRRLDITRLITGETNAQIRAIQDFITANRAAIDAGLALPLGGTPIFPTISGGQVTNVFNGGITVDVHPHPGMTPREAWEAVHDGIEWGMGHRHEI